MIVAFLNQKGGVGKTSLCHHLAGAFAELGRNVLLVDCDPQASLTQGLLGPSFAETLPPSATVAAILEAGALIDPCEVVHPTGFSRIHLIPGSIFAAELNAPRPWERPSGECLALRSFLEMLRLRSPLDCVLIDCPPNLGLCSWSAVVAADCVVIPAQTEDYGAQGIGPVLSFLDRVRATDGFAPELAGIVLSMHDRRLKLHQQYERALREVYGAVVFRDVVPRLAAFAESITHRCPVTVYAPNSPAAMAIRAVAGELGSRAAAGVPAGGGNQ